MARRRYEEEATNHERWLVSYADFITLLFAFFVVMYAVSSVNDQKYQALSESLLSAFSNEAGAGVLQPVQPLTPSPSLLLPKTLSRERAKEQALRQERDHMTAIARDILKVLAPLVRQGKVRVTQSPRGVNVEINASVLFAPATANLSSESMATLTAVAKVLQPQLYRIQVEGHTDNQPIATTQFPSNWELSAVRASSVVRLFLAESIDEVRLVAVGHGSNRALESNDTAEGRQRNRRVQVVILSGLPEESMEVPLKQAAPASASMPASELAPALPS